MLENAKVSIGELIAETRKKRGLSQKKLAELTGIPFRTLQDIEWAKGDPGFSTVAKLVRALELPAETVFGTSTKQISSTAVKSGLTAGDCAAILEQLEKVSPYKRALALTVLFEDPTLFDGIDVPEELPDSLQALLKAR